MKSIEMKGSSVESATEEALAQLGIKREQAIIEVISEGGLFSKAAVKVTQKQQPEEAAQEFLSGLFEKMRLNCQVLCEAKEKTLYAHISGPDSGVAIGYRGEVLDGIQYLTLLVVNKEDEDFFKVVIDAENYRDKRASTLKGLANRLAYKAYKTGKSIELEPMNPFERRIIHTALQESTYATTTSKGEEPRRHVVIIPKERAADDFEEKRMDSIPSVDFSVKKKGPPKVKSFGYKKRF